MKKYSIGGLGLSLGATVHGGRAGEPLLWFLKMASPLRALGRVPAEQVWHCSRREGLESEVLCLNGA